MSKNLESISNIEAFCKKYDLEGLSKKDEPTFEDYKNLLDSMVKDSRKHAKNVSIIKGVSAAVAILTGCVSGWQVYDGIKNNNMKQTFIAASTGFAVLTANGVISNILNKREITAIKDNALFAEDMYSVTPKKYIE